MVHWKLINHLDETVGAALTHPILPYQLFESKLIVGADATDNRIKAGGSMKRNSKGCGMVGVPSYSFRAKDHSDAHRVLLVLQKFNDAEVKMWCCEFAESLPVRSVDKE